MEGLILGLFTALLVLHDSKYANGDRGRVYMETSPASVVMPIDDETLLICEMNLAPDKFEWRHYPLKAHDASNPSVFIPLGTAHSINLPASAFTSEKKISTLKIKSSNKSVSGDYQCLAHYGASIVASIPGRITITSFGSFSPQKSVDVTVSAGNTVNWRCTPPPSNPPALIDYFKDEAYVQPSKDLLGLIKSVIIPNVTAENSGSYHCVANNVILRNSSRSEFKMNLKVVKGSHFTIPRYILSPNNLYTASLGDTVFLECSAVGNPVPKVVWVKKNGELPANRTKLLDGGLLIRNVKPSDDGVYICNHTNIIGTVSFHITLIYNEPPTIHNAQSNIKVKEGENLDLECTFHGTPEPRISWFLNGQSVVNDTLIEAVGGQIYFRPIEKRHAGILQCFATNVAGINYSSINLEVFPKQLSSSDIFDEYSPPQPTPSNHKRRKHKSKSKHRGTNEMIPPSKPTVTRLSDESVMVRWTVPDNNGLPITFFKVQYRELGPIHHTGTHKGSKWRTTNADIEGHIRSFEVNNLKPDHAYRFRIAAVYSNNDNKLGPNSAKFFLNRADFFAKNPLPVPRLVFTETVNESAIRIHWEIASPSNSTIDGFFIHYLPVDSAGDYMKATVEGQDVRSYLICHLQQSTVYDIKLQSFTSKSASEFSPIMKQSTAVGVEKSPQSPHKKHPGGKDKDVAMTDMPVMATNPPSSKSSGQGEMYIIIGAVVGGIALILSLIVLFIIYKKRKHKKGSTAGGSCNNDKDDVSHHIQADVNDYVVSSKTLTRVNGCTTSANRITITPNPLADADNKSQNMIEMSCLSSQNNNSQPSVSAMPMSHPAGTATTNSATTTTTPSSGDSANVLLKNKLKNADRQHKNNNNKRPGAGGPAGIESTRVENYV